MNNWRELKLKNCLNIADYVPPRRFIQVELKFYRNEISIS